jgi:hypothetical protein
MKTSTNPRRQSCRRTGKIGSTSGGGDKMMGERRGRDIDARRGASIQYSSRTRRGERGHSYGGGIEMGLDLRDLLLHRGDGVPCVDALADRSRSRLGSMHLFPFCAQQSHRYRQAIAEPRTHLDGLAGLRRSGLSRLGLGFHIAGQFSRFG